MSNTNTIAIKETPSIILSSNQVNRLYHRFFVPKSEVHACLLIVHGMSEHSERYDKFAQFLADNGVLVLTYDLLGHGKTIKDKYELGFFDSDYPVQFLSKDVIIMSDALKVYAKTHTKNSAIPCFIMGHSMGSMIVRTVLTHHATSFDGVILTGLVSPNPTLSKSASIALAAMNFYRPKRKNTQLAALINTYLTSKLSSPISPSSLAWLSENTDNILAFENDPLCGFEFTNNGYYTLALLAKKSTNPTWYERISPTLPIFVLGGQNDPAGEMGEDIRILQDELLAAGKSVSVRLYPNMRHEILHEIGQQKVFEDIKNHIYQQSR